MLDGPHLKIAKKLNINRKKNAVLTAEYITRLISESWIIVAEANK